MWNNFTGNRCLFNSQLFPIHWKRWRILIFIYKISKNRLPKLLIAKNILHSNIADLGVKSHLLNLLKQHVRGHHCLALGIQLTYSQRRNLNYFGVRITVDRNYSYFKFAHFTISRSFLLKWRWVDLRRTGVLVRYNGCKRILYFILSLFSLLHFSSWLHI